MEQERLTPAPRDHALIFQTYSQTAECDFKSSVRFVVADEKICDAQRMPVKGAANRDTELAKTISAKILNAGQKSCLRDA